MGTTSADVLLELDRSRPRGLRSQIEDGLRAAIQTGRLPAGSTLPSTRALAADLGVTRGVVVDAYDQLVAEGYLSARPGSGTFVTDASLRRPRAPRPQQGAARPPIDFRVGFPDPELFPRAAWARATRAALRALPNADLGYADALGLLVLRHALADYLGRVRGVRADPDLVVVCNGFGHALSLATTALSAQGCTTFAVEDPGYAGPRLLYERTGVPHHGVRVDEEGLVVDELRRTNAHAAVVTPAHQSPTGVVLSAARRHELLEWASAVDGFVIEDDYDAEYRYDRRPVGAMQGIAPERVIYCGTASKSLAPGLRLGWLVVPGELAGRIRSIREVTDGATSSVQQATYAEFLVNGDLDRHLRRARRIYRERRDVIVDALRRWVPDAVPVGVSAGLHVLVALPAGIDEDAVVSAAAAAGVGVYPLGAHRSRRARDVPPGILLGYGLVRAEQAERGVRTLADVLDALRP